MKRQRNPCIVCGRPVASLLPIARYCGVCRAAVADIRRGIHRQIQAAALPHPSEFDCSDCGKPATEYEHRYYALPLEVEPVCTSCNLKRGPALDVVELVQARLAMTGKTKGAKPTKDWSKYQVK